MASKARILVVDDEPSVTNLLRLMLETRGYGVLATEDGRQAVEWLKAPDEHIDMMITDLRMNPIDGITLLRIAREERPAMPAMLVTAYASQKTEMAAKALGACAYISKPFQMGQILDAVQAALAGESA